jgi:DNA-binding NtrC family response regulator
MSTVPAAPANKRAYDRTSYILVVDDDNTLLKFFKIHLNKFFSRVIVVKNAKEAVDTLREKEIDLVLTDIRMPRMDGLQLMKRVRKHDPSIPVLLISGALLSEDQSKAAEDDADGYLRKPFSVDDLHTFLNNGMDLREKYKKLADLLPDRKMIRDLLRGKAKVEKLIADAEARAAATGILDELKQAG